MARKRLPGSLFDQLDHGSESDVSYQHNRKVLDQTKLIHRVLRDVSKRNTSIELFGKEQSLPLIMGPTGITSWLSYRGELAMARVAAKHNIPFTLTSTTDTPMEEVRSVGGKTWYQAIMWNDLDASLAGISRAAKAGFDVLIFTVDSTIPYNRPWDKRRKIKFPLNGLRLGHLTEAIKKPSWTFSTPAQYLLRHRQLPGFSNIEAPSGLEGDEKQRWFTKDDSLDWAFFERLRDIWPREIVIKGILHPDDAIEATSRGADGIVVSNHGGATNDSAPSPLEALPAIRAAVDENFPVLIDSGFRRGSDVLKALALGANSVLVGRAALYGLGAAGELGADRAISILGEEIKRTLGMLGLNSIAELGPDAIFNSQTFDNLNHLTDFPALDYTAVSTH